MKANAMTTLLIVDDNREMRQLMKSIVSKACEDVFECEDGDQVVDAFTAHRPDWVLMDIAMPFLKGASLEDWYKQKKKDQPGTPRSSST